MPPVKWSGNAYPVNLRIQQFEPVGDQIAAQLLDEAGSLMVNVPEPERRAAARSGAATTWDENRFRDAVRKGLSGIASPRDYRLCWYWGEEQTEDEIVSGARKSKPAPRAKPKYGQIRADIRSVRGTGQHPAVVEIGSQEDGSYITLCGFRKLWCLNSGNSDHFALQ